VITTTARVTARKARPRRSTRYLVAAGAVAAVAVSGCGSHAGASSSSSQAQLAVAAGAQNSQAASLRYDLTANIGVDASKLRGLGASELAKLSGLQSVAVTADAEQENASRQKINLSLKSGNESHTATIVNYDGTVYYSLDGGAVESGAKPKQLSGGVGTALNQPAKYLDSVPGFQDKGTVQKDGVTVEQYEAAIDQSLIAKLFAGALSQGSGQNTSEVPPQVASMLQGFLQQLVHIDSGTADAYVRWDDGRLDRATLTTSLTVDLSNLGSMLGELQSLGVTDYAATSAPQGGLPDGQVHANIKVNAHMYDYGASITVTRPNAVASTSTQGSDGLGLFG
jgi:hypothetical protein